MPDTSSLNKAKQEKKDEFYTSIEVIEAELRYHKKSFKDKIVLCNCDDPFESNFFKYFCLNFEVLGLKKLICTCYAGSKVAYTQLSLFDQHPETNENLAGKEKKAYVIEVSRVIDFDGDGAISISDIEALLRSEQYGPKLLEGSGDYASPECMKYLRECDIVVTNPPFSKWIPFFNTLIQSGKQFLILGNVNALTYKEVFPQIMANIVWLGASIHSGDREFRVPDDYPLEASGFRIDEQGNKYIRVKGVRWYTNMDFKERHETLDLYKTYSPELYPKYDNYDVINVDKTSDIPCDYYGIMGVPITFLDKYDPDQFIILGCTQRGCHDAVPDTKRYDDYWEVTQSGKRTGSSGSKTNENANLAKNDGKHNYFINSEGHIVQSCYGRVFIKRRGAEQ